MKRSYPGVGWLRSLFVVYSKQYFVITDSCFSVTSRVTYHKLFWRCVAMKQYIEKLKQHIADNPPDFGDADSVLGLMYECKRKT